MTLSKLNDQTLHSQLKHLVKNERALLIQILDHLREIERRKLYCDFNRSSLFDYAVTELGYSEDQAHRRIQAMRLIKAVPEVAEKIATGAISLTNASRAQGLFRRSSESKSAPELTKNEKLAVLKKIEHKSTREAEKELLSFQPKDVLPVDRQRALTEDHVELKVVVDQKTVAKLEQVRGLLGVKGATMSHAELLYAMADISIATLQGERFGKRRAPASVPETAVADSAVPEASAPEAADENPLVGSPKVNPKSTKDQRYITRAVKHAVWKRDGGRCQNCRSHRNLHFDHIRPFALGGPSSLANLRLLCFACNQRAAIRVFGVERISRERVP